MEDTTQNHLEKQDRLLSYGMYCHYIKDIKHFEMMQTYFRIMTSSILLGCFVAMGFIFSSAGTHIPFERSLAQIFISLIGIGAMITLWRLDLIFYERLLTCNFYEALKLEEKHSFLPKVHHNILYKFEHYDKPSTIVYYYIGCISTLVLTSGLFTFYHFRLQSTLVKGAIVFAIMITLILFSLLLKTKTKKRIFLINKLMKT